MRLTSFKHKEKQDPIAENPLSSFSFSFSSSTTTSPNPASIPTSPKPSIPTTTATTAVAASPAGVFGVRNTPVRIPPGRATIIPSVQIQAFTAAATSGYTVSLTLNPRSKTVGGEGYSAALSAPAPSVQVANNVLTEVPGRLWKPLPLTPTTNTTSPKSPNLNASSTTDAEKGEVYALQSTDLTTNTVHVLLLPTINLSSWMSSLPSTDPLSSFCIPGTHESCALYGWPISACQGSTSSISYQLSRGIRFLDIRLALKGTPGKQRLYAYHRVTDERIEFSAILSQVYSFLTANPSETVLMSVKQENNMAGFLDSVFTYINQNLNQWHLGTGMPKLEDVRAKIVLLSRFGSSTSQPGGIHPPIWPDSSPTPFAYTLPDGCKVVTQDWYNIGSLSAIPTKLKLIQTLLDMGGSDPAVLGLNFTNGSSFPIALPPFVAKGSGVQSKGVSGRGWFSNIGVNALLVDLVATRLKGAFGVRAGLMNIFALDFFDQNNLGADLASLMVHANFQ
ncbi:related to 1-phosphatidylinositol phosphodiesterase precursor [Ustilago bromivora]|uniref:Related to 1-phosphatidylinositol phosphodiesterase n=1 Tax=Ustilago bromivora TaxID=307758 RepID=A0A1K0HG97_9BASI|nr:related to 1-phosphatidylinositol phosphodiesterase precursor [Ustilago bromivora]SYW73848.1 related to 1-phosphatidylinositol phosphodiesterase precursor [Ustilago bromivora]